MSIALPAQLESYIQRLLEEGSYSRPEEIIAEDTEKKLKEPSFTDATSRAHLEETRARTRATLDAQIAKGVD